VTKFLDRCFWVATGACAVGACALLVGIAATIVWNGLPAINWQFLVGEPGQAFASGGIRYQILGTVLLVITALVVAVPLAVGLALVQTVYLGSTHAKLRLRLCIYGANGIPSILFGILGLLVFVQLFGWGKSWLAGGIVLGMMILPTLTVVLVERIEAIPAKYLAAAAAMGLGKSGVVRAVILPQTRGGLLVGALLGLARAAGETAPIMFTAAVFSGATFPAGIRESPVVALPYHLFVLAQDSFDATAQGQMWGAAVVLLGFVLALSLIALPARLKSSEEAQHG